MNHHLTYKSAAMPTPVNDVDDDYDAEHDGKLLRISEVARLGRVSISTATRWAEEGLMTSDGSRLILKTIRTAGGHRRSAERWVKEFKEQAATTNRLRGVALQRHQARLEREATD